MRRLGRERREATFAVALAIAAALEIAVLYSVRLDAPAAPVVPLAIVLPIALAWRTKAPLQVLTAVAAGWIVVDAYTGAYDVLPTTFALLAAVYSAGAHARGRARAAAGAVVATLIAASAAEDYWGGSLYDLGGAVIFYASLHCGLWFFGRIVARRRMRERELIVERDEGARAAVAEERARIARELHDVVAHAISVIVLQARGARHAEGTERDEALEAIESTGATALTEMRRLLHMLRADDEAVALAPQPSLAHLEPLVAQVRDAGLPVELHIEGEPRELPPGVDVSAYRIVQEALTNALKHAGPARARVSVRYEDDAVALEIADTGAGTGNGGSGTGHGLLGMRERAAVFGGEVDSGPRKDGGFVVRARLPL